MSREVAAPLAGTGLHVAGIGVLLLAFACVGLVAMLPTKSAASIELPFLTGQQPPVVAAFAGYPGCGTICPTGLALLGAAYRTLDPRQRQQVGLRFISVQRNATQAATENFAKAWDPAFRGHVLTANEAPAVYSALALRSADNAADAAMHSGYIYLFKRHGGDWRLEQVYRRPPTPAALAARLRELVGMAG